MRVLFLAIGCSAGIGLPDSQNDPMMACSRPAPTFAADLRYLFSKAYSSKHSVCTQVVPPLAAETIEISPEDTLAQAGSVIAVVEGMLVVQARPATLPPHLAFLADWRVLSIANVVRCALGFYIIVVPQSNV